MKNSSKAGAEDRGKSLSLIQQFNTLEKEWESLQKSKPLQSTRRCSTGSYSNNNSSSSNILTSFNKLIENSPRGLMSSLQHRRSPSDGILRVRNCDMAVEEILRDRRAAITSGKLKGRRLFESAEVEMDLDYGDGDGHDHGVDDGEVRNDWSYMIRERDVSMNGISNGNESQERRGDDDGKLPDALAKGCSSFSDSLSQEKVVVIEKTVVESETKKAEERRKRGGVGKLRGGRGGGGAGGRCIGTMAWLAFVLILVILGVVVISCNGRFVHEELILVPT